MLKSKRAPLTLLLLSYLLSPVLVSAEPSPRTLSLYEFSLGFNITHNVISGNYLDRAGNELLILGEKDNGKQVMAIYGLDEQVSTFVLLDEFVLPDNIVAFDTIIDVKGKAKVVLLSATRLSLISFNLADQDPAIISRERIIFDGQSSIYANPRPQFIAKKSLVRDLNGDGFDDIVVSDFASKKIFLQKNVNGKSEFLAQKLPIDSIVDMGKEQIAFVERPIFSVDANFDQIIDIVVAGTGELQVYKQLADQTFSDQAKIISLPMDVSDLPWWYLRDTDGETADQSNLFHQKLETITDINGDGILDLMIMNTRSSGVLDRKNRYDIYFGKTILGELVFGESPDTEIGSEGTLTGLKLLDVDGDGIFEVYVQSFDIGLTQIIGALISGKIKQDIYFFSLNSNDKYDSEPNYSDRVELSFSLSKGRVGEPIVEYADLDGDGLQELILSSKNDKLAIHDGISSLEHFTAKSRLIKLEVPAEGSMVKAMHIFSQEKKDIVIRYGRQDDAKLRRKVLVLSY